MRSYVMYYLLRTAYFFQGFLSRYFPYPLIVPSTLQILSEDLMACSPFWSLLEQFTHQSDRSSSAVIRSEMKWLSLPRYSSFRIQLYILRTYSYLIPGY